MIDTFFLTGLLLKNYTHDKLKINENRIAHFSCSFLLLLMAAVGLFKVFYS